MHPWPRRGPARHNSFFDRSITKNKKDLSIKKQSWMTLDRKEISMNAISNNYTGWQEEKRLSSGDDICILTDIQVSRGRYVPQARDQRRFRVGIYDFTAGRFGFLLFTSDDAFALLKAGLPCAPWSRPPPFRIRYHRRSRPSRSGRLVVRAELTPVSNADHARPCRWFQCLRTARPPPECRSRRLGQRAGTRDARAYDRSGNRREGWMVPPGRDRRGDWLQRIPSEHGPPGTSKAGPIRMPRSWSGCEISLA